MAPNMNIWCMTGSRSLQLECFGTWMYPWRSYTYPCHKTQSTSKPKLVSFGTLFRNWLLLRISQAALDQMCFSAKCFHVTGGHWHRVCHRGRLLAPAASKTKPGRKRKQLPQNHSKFIFWTRVISHTKETCTSQLFHWLKNDWQHESPGA